MLFCLDFNIVDDIALDYHGLSRILKVRLGIAVHYYSIVGLSNGHHVVALAVVLWTFRRRIRQHNDRHAWSHTVRR